MAEFKYKARNRSGKVVKGTISSKEASSVKNSLYNRGLTPIQITKQLNAKDKVKTGGINDYIYRDENGAIQISLGPSYPTAKELALFTKQFSLMVENGVNIVSALKLLKRSQKKKAFANIVEAVANDIEKGAALNEALEPYSRVFDELYVAMIAAGEKSGKLDIILKQLVRYIEKAAKIKAQVKSAMTYPTMIVVVAVTVVSLLLTFVVPSFAKQFQEANQKLPELTQIVVDLSEALTNNWDYILGTIILAIVSMKVWLGTDQGKRVFDRFILKAPIIGDVMRKIAVGRFCSTMSTMLSSGVSIIESLRICAQASGNKMVEEFVFTVKEEVEKGGSFYGPLEQSPMFPPLVTSMVEVGESTGKLDETLAKITEIYEEEVDTAIETMTSMIEPLMIVIIGTIVGFIVLAMYLPVFDMASTVTG